MKTRKNAADKSIIPKPKLWTVSEVGESLETFDRPYLVEELTSSTNEDGETVYNIVAATWINDIFLWELINWQLIGIANVINMSLDRVDSDGLYVYDIIAVAAQSWVPPSTKSAPQSDDCGCDDSSENIDDNPDVEPSDFHYDDRPYAPDSDGTQ